MSTNTAWVTLATNDSYCLGALVLGHSLRRVNTVHQLAVLITPGVSPPMRQQLSSIFNVVKEVDVMNSGDEANLALMARPDLGITFTKLHCWNLTQFSKCVFLDADTLVIQNCDELFEREELSAAPDVGWPDCFNSGVFVFVPSKDTFKALLDCALALGSFDGGDQGLLNTFFGDWATKDIKKHLPFIYNMVSSATYSYLPAFKLFGSQVKIVHFLGINKPWLQGSGGTAPTMSGYLDLWWTIFKSHVSQNLTSDMISNCTFDGVRWPNHPSSMPSPFPVHQHSYDHFRNLEQEQAHEEERHEFIDPWETVTLDQVQNTSQIYSPIYQNRTTYSLGRTHDNVDSEHGIHINVTQRGSSEIGTRDNVTQVAPNYFQPSFHPNNGSEQVPAVIAASSPLPHTQYLSEQMTVIEQNNAPPQVNQIDYLKHNKSNQVINPLSSVSPSNHTDYHVHTNTYQIPPETSSIVNQFLHQSEYHNHPSSSTLSTSISPSPRPAVAMHSNNHSQSCFHQLQDIPSNGAVHQEAGLAGALAVGERSAFEEVWRRQNWEQGVIDYMGRDSFDNIWRKISESVGISSTPSAAVPPASVTPQPSPAPSETVQDQGKVPTPLASEPVVAAAVAPPLQSEPPSTQSEQPKTEGSDKGAEPKAAAAPTTPKTEEIPVPLAPVEPVATDKQAAVEPTAPKVPEDKEKTSASTEKKTEATSAETPKTEPTLKKDGESPKPEVPTPDVATAAELQKTSPPAADVEASKAKEVSKLESVPPPVQAPQPPESTPQKDEAAAKTEVPKEPVTPVSTEAGVPDKATESKKEIPAEENKTQQTAGGRDNIQVVKETELKASAEDKCQKDSPKPPQETAKSDVPAAPALTEIQKSEVVAPPIPLPEAPKKEAPKVDTSAEPPKTETPKTETEVAPKTDIPAEAQKADATPKESKADLPSTEAKDVKSAPQTKEQKTDKPKEGVLPEATKAEEPKTPPPSSEAVAAQKAESAPVETPKEDASSKKPTSQAAAVEKPPTETPKGDSAPKVPPSAEPAPVPVLEPMVAPAVISKDSVPPTGGIASEPLSPVTPTSPGVSGTPEVPVEGAAAASKSPSEPKKSAPQTPAEGTSAEKAAAAPVPPKRKGNKEQKSQNGGKQSKSKK